LFETQSATHWFLQHLLVRPIIFYSTSNSIKTRLINWKQGPGIQSWISKLCLLISGIINKVGLGISRTNADSQWNPVDNVCHRFFCCGNETIRRYLCKRDLDAANLRPALEQACGKQTPGAKKLFFQANLLYVPDVKM